MNYGLTSSTYRRRESEGINEGVVSLSKRVLWILLIFSEFVMPREHLLNTPKPRLKLEVDVIIVSKSELQILNATVVGLRNYLIPCPRHIYVIVPASHLGECRQIANVKCIDEKSMVVVDCQQVQCILAGKGYAWARELAPNRGCWYYQQMVKLLSVTVLPLSGYYFIWDADNVLLRRYNAFVGSTPRILTSGSSVREYIPTTAALLHLTPTRERIVTHQALIHKRTMLQIIDHLCPTRDPSTSFATSCAMRIIEKIPKRQWKVNIAFSEYHLYFSWLLYYGSQQVYLDRRTTFKRKRIPVTYDISSLNANVCRTCPYAVLEHVHQAHSGVENPLRYPPTGISGLLHVINVYLSCRNGQQ